MLRFIEKVFTIGMLLYASGGLLSMFTNPASGYSRIEGNPLALAIQMGFYAVAGLFILRDWRAYLHTAWNAKWIVALSALAIASTAWSTDPSFTLRRSLVLLASTAFGIYFGSRYTLSEQLRLLAWTCTILLIACYATGILLPQLGIDHGIHSGDWQGVFNQKNALARAMVFSAFVFYFVRPAAYANLRWLGVAGSLGLLTLSRSVTGILVFAIVVATLPLYRLLRSKITMLIPVGIVVTMALLVLVPILSTSAQDALLMLNRSPTLTGRTELWNAVLMAISKHPWWGYGFNTFWTGIQGASASVMLQVGWFPKHSHNGFLDLLLDLGAAGLFTFLAGYLVLWSKAIRCLRTTPGLGPVWLCIYLAFMFVYNLTESSILVQNNLFWMLYVSSAATLFIRQPTESFRSEIISELQTNHYCLQG